MKIWLAKLKYYLLRKYLIEEMIREGWRQDPTQAGRLMREDPRSDAARPEVRFTVNPAEHEAIARHFKEYPLFNRTPQENGKD